MANMNEDNTLSDFLTLTDRKTLFKKIGECVRIGKAIDRKELQERRNKLRILLDDENTIYETQWAERMMNRRAEDIERRTAVVLEHNRNKELLRQNYLASANIKRNILTCPEIRDALKEKEVVHGRHIQLHQIDEKLRDINRERALDKIWQEINRRGLEEFNKNQEYEDGLRKCLTNHLVHVWDLQCEDHELEKEKERLEKLKEKIEIENIIKENQINEFDKKIKKPIPQKNLEYKQQLLNQIAENAAKRQKYICDEYNAEMEIRERDERKNIERKEQFKRDKRQLLTNTLEFIHYTKRMRSLKNFEYEITEKCLDEAVKVNQCTDRHRVYDLAKRATDEKAQYEALKKQINLINERKEIEERDRKKLAPTSIYFKDKSHTDEEKKQIKQMVSADLIKQMKDNKEYKEKVERDYEAQFAEPYRFDPEVCKKLADEYIRESIDYTPVHENWIIHECAHNKDFLPGKRDGHNRCYDSAIQPCGCAGRGMVSKCGEMKVYEMIS